MSGDLQTRDKQNQEVDSSEQYAINMIGDRALQSADYVVKESRRTLEKAIGKRTTPAVFRANTSRQAYAEMKRQYQSEAERAQAQVVQLEQQTADISAQTSSNPWLQNFTQFAGETELTEGTAHALIQRIEVDKNENITIHLKYRDEYTKLASLLNSEAAL